MSARLAKRAADGVDAGDHFDRFLGHLATFWEGIEMADLSFDELFCRFWRTRVGEFYEDLEKHGESQRVYSPKNTELRVGNPRRVTDMNERIIVVQEILEPGRQRSLPSGGPKKLIQNEFGKILNDPTANWDVTTKTLRDHFGLTERPQESHDPWFEYWTEFKRDMYWDFLQFANAEIEKCPA